MNSEEIKKINDAVTKIQQKITALTLEENTTINLRLYANKAGESLIKLQKSIYRIQDEILAIEEMTRQEAQQIDTAKQEKLKEGN
jgi:hypothetical protein